MMMRDRQRRVLGRNGTGAATAALIAAGVDGATAAATVRRPHGTGHCMTSGNRRNPAGAGLTPSPSQPPLSQWLSFPLPLAFDRAVATRIEVLVRGIRLPRR
ncbi:hypothetical protein [Streptomyces sp. 11x1]|uniref:hypothetical protein n=1 Tax=Streptomyces sp. 11x1 TaxID=3038642 RepID=UPI00292E661F|nr:hypothetical protein [Streptomyces sp. 11x1]WNZ10834.1 hypothetical protein P8T65_26935 [Streptomyces sp. 11x1]